VYATLGLLQDIGVGIGAIVIVIVAIFVVSVIFSAIKIVKEYERGVIFRIGRVQGGPKGPGLFILLPVVDRRVKIDLRTVTMEIPPQEIITRDNVPARVTTVIYFRVVDPNKSASSTPGCLEHVLWILSRRSDSGRIGYTYKQQSTAT